MEKNQITVFTDGSSRGNPGPGGWGAVIVYSEQVTGESKKIKEIGGWEKKTTNNQMELKSAIEALKFISTFHTLHSTIILYSDSSYVRNGITKWVYGWQKNGWVTKEKKEVLNKDLWQELVEVSRNLKIDWRAVPAHAGVPLNERCDEIATFFADGKNPHLYTGSANHYGVSIVTPEEHFAGEKFEKKKGKKGKAFSYISKVDGKISITKTWAECEKQVKGKKGARFKKALSKMEEEEIIKEFR